MAVVINSRSDVEQWLVGKPSVWTLAVSLRSAEKSFPLCIDPIQWRGGVPDSRLVLDTVRALLNARDVANKLTEGKIEPFRALSGSTPNSELIYNSYKNEASEAARWAAIAPLEALGVARHLADENFSEANHWAGDAVGDAVDSIEHAIGSSPDLWRNIAWECAALEKGKSLEDSLNDRLWIRRPDWFKQAWNGASRWLSKPEEGFEIWREWYYGRLEGLPYAFAGFDDQADAAFYKQILEYDDAWWSRDPAEVNADIKALVDSLRKPKKDAVDFFISYAGEDEAAARQVAEVLDDLGKSYLVQYRDFAQQNFVNAMNDAMGRAERVIPLYSKHFVASDHCNAEWNHFYNRDPSSAERRIVALRLDHADLTPLMAQIVFKDLTTLPRAERRAAIRDWITWEPQEPTRENIAKTVTTHLDPGVVANDNGKLDTTPDPDLNAPEVPAELARAMDELRMMLDLVRRSERNLSSMMQGTLALYDDHFTERGKESSWGGLDRYIAIVTDGLPAMSNVELGEEKKALEQLIAAHNKCMAALKNVDEQLRELANVPIESADQVSIDELVSRFNEFASELRELGATTQGYDAHVDTLVSQGRDIAFEAGAPDAEQKPKRAITRYLLYLGGFGIATLNVLGSMASIRSAPETQQVLAAGERLLEAFFRIVGL